MLRLTAKAMADANPKSKIAILKKIILLTNAQRKVKIE
ncbi:hypothetical protein BH18ACI3_BH18ACI3_00050 [soil metagenome]